MWQFWSEASCLLKTMRETLMTEKKFSQKVYLLIVSHCLHNQKSEKKQFWLSVMRLNNPMGLKQKTSIFINKTSFPMLF